MSTHLLHPLSCYYQAPRSTTDSKIHPQEEMKKGHDFDRSRRPFFGACRYGNASEWQHGGRLRRRGGGGKRTRCRGCWVRGGEGRGKVLAMTPVTERCHQYYFSTANTTSGLHSRAEVLVGLPISTLQALCLPV